LLRILRHKISLWRSLAPGNSKQPNKKRLPPFFSKDFGRLPQLSL
jgi:hypothetical protein